MSDYAESQRSFISAATETPTSAKIDFDAIRKQMEERHQASWDDLSTGRSKDMPSDLRAEHRREAAALELDRAAYERGEPLPSVVVAEMRATQPTPYREALHFRNEFEAEYGQPAIDLARKHWDEYEAHRTGNGQPGDTYADLKRRQDLEEIALGKAVDAERIAGSSLTPPERIAGSSLTPAERIAGSSLTPAERVEVEQIEARWRKIEATSEFREIVASFEAQVDASRIGEADDHISKSPVSTPETAVERAAAMQQAREHAFTQHAVSQAPTQEMRHHPATTRAAEHGF